MNEVLEDNNGNNETIAGNPQENVNADEIVQTGSEGSMESVETNGFKTTPTVTAEPELDDN